MSCSGIVEEDVVLSLQQTVTESKTEEKEELEIEQQVEEEKKEEEEVLEKEIEQEIQNMNLLKIEQVSSSAENSTSLYDKLKDEPEALTVLAPAAGDTIISLDFGCPGQYLNFCLQNMPKGII